MEKTTKRWRATYEQPLIELCAAEPYKFLAASNTDLGGGAGEGDAPPEGDIVGAKGQEPFSEYLWD